MKDLTVKKLRKLLKRLDDTDVLYISSVGNIGILDYTSAYVGYIDISAGKLEFSNQEVPSLCD